VPSVGESLGCEPEDAFCEATSLAIEDGLGEGLSEGLGVAGVCGTGTR
jgi:hypothetical protein